MASNRDGFSLSVSGLKLVVNPAWPFLGASPDGIMNCTCCGNGVLEIKCPFACKNKSFLDASKERSKFFLCESNGKMTLDRTHTYYYQVQAQIEVCGAKYCDFVVWSEKEVLVERINPIKEFIVNAFDKASTFIKLGVWPELMAKWYSKVHMPSLQSTPVASSPMLTEATPPKESVEKKQKLYCICRQEEYGHMIACDNEACSVTWFHVTCLHMKRVPKGKWHCPECRQRK